jgi:heme exporter protein A
VSPQEARAALQRLRVPEAYVRRLSQGQKRRAALARLCLSEEAPLWLLDEPFTALDPEGIGVLKELMQAHASRGGMVVYTTHQDPGMAATRVLELG